MSTNRHVTPDTLVVITMRGETGSYQLAPGGPAGAATLTAWSNTLSDLTGYTATHVQDTLLRELPRRYGVELYTAGGKLCPIRFLVTLADSQAANELAARSD